MEPCEVEGVSLQGSVTGGLTRGVPQSLSQDLPQGLPQGLPFEGSTHHHGRKLAKGSLEGEVTRRRSAKRDGPGSIRVGDPESSSHVGDVSGRFERDFDGIAETRAPRRRRSTTGVVARGTAGDTKGDTKGDLRRSMIRETDAEKVHKA